jgi:hypothetical protein
MDLTGGEQIVAILEEEYAEKIKVVYPRAEEELVDFLQRCKLNKTEVMMCPRCSAVFDKKTTNGLKKYVPSATNKGNWSNKRLVTSQNIIHHRLVHQRLGYQTSFVPSNKTPTNQWVHGHPMMPNRRIIEKGSSSNSRPQNYGEANKYAYKNNYIGKNPMNRTQWRRHQRQKKLALQNIQSPADNKGKKVVKLAKNPVKDRLSPSGSNHKTEEKVEDEHMEADDFLESEPDFDVVVNVVSILPAEYGI